jgi:adenosylhomocysteine nucleosidase
MTNRDTTGSAWLVCVATAHELQPLKRPLGLVRSAQASAVPLFEGRAGRQRVVVLQTGIGPKRAHRIVTQRLEQQACQGVISIGLSGGLRASLVSGTLIVGDHWVRLEKRPEGDRFEMMGNVGPPADRRLRAAALRAAGLCGIPAHEGELATVNCLVGTVRDKQALAERTTALAVDMESAAVAEAAIAAGMAVIAARVILDPMDEALDVSPERFLREDGSPSLWKSGLAVMGRPVQWPALWSLGRRSTRAMNVLARWLCRVLDEGPAIGP